MAKWILNDFETLISLSIGAQEKTVLAGDLATSDLLIAYNKRTEKSHWILNTYIK